MNRVPPHSAEAEKGLLGCLIMKPDLIPNLRERLKVPDFYMDKHQKLYKALLDMSAANDGINLVSLAEKMKPDISVGYVSGLVDGIPPKTDIGSFLTIIEEKSKLRDIIGGNITIVLGVFVLSVIPS